jgi:hypothetical protein
MLIKRALPRATAKRIGPFSRRTRKASAIRRGAAKHRSAIISSETLVKGKGMAEALLAESGYDGKVEAIRDAFVRASSLEEQKKIAADIQQEVYDQVIYIPLGEFRGAAAWRKSLSGVLAGPVRYSGILTSRITALRGSRPRQSLDRRHA